MNNAENYLEIKNLVVKHKSYEGLRTVLDIDSLAIKKGTTYGIVGESGAGKTVLALTIQRLLATPPGVISSGEIYIDGEDVLKKSNHEMQKIRGSKVSMIFQDPMSALNPVFTVEQLMTGILVQRGKAKGREAKEQVLEMLRTVRLPDPEDIMRKYPHELSGGQRQRVIIGMALLCGAELLIADEPTRNLDVTIQAGILRLLFDLQKKFNITVLFIANNLALVSAVCDEVAILKDGKIVDRGDAKVLLETTTNPYTLSLIHAVTPEHIGQSDAAKKNVENNGSKEILLEVSHLKKYFPVKSRFGEKSDKYVKAVDDVSFVMHKKETMGIVGESGCGKSTLVNTIMFLHAPTEGTVKFNGSNIFQLSPQELSAARKNVQIVFQDPFWSLNPRWLVKDIIGEPIKVHMHLTPDEYLESVQEMAELVGLEKDDVFKYPHEFSGGQRQRIAIARALSVRPQLVILDEPTSAIDVLSQSKILEILDELKDKMNLTYIIISHDLCVVNYMASKIMVMYLGTLVEYGDSRQIFSNPKHPYTKALFNAIPTLETKSVEDLAIIKGEVPSAINPPEGCRFHTRCEHCMEMCKHQTPEMRCVDGRMVACHLYNSMESKA